MQPFKVLTSERKLDIPVSQLSEKKPQQKSCFIDSNRVDTVKTAKKSENKKE